MQPALLSLLSGCAQAPVSPIPEPTRRSVTSISGDVSGLKHADTSRLGARGSAEGAQLGAQQGASLFNSTCMDFSDLPSGIVARPFRPARDLR